MDSKVGLIIQLNGVFIITVLCLLLSRSLRLTALKYWTIAWSCLSFSLICLRLAFSYEDFGSLLLAYYYLGEYLFGFLLLAGCRSLAGNWDVKTKHELWFTPFLIVSIVLPMVTPDFSNVYSIHSMIMAGLYGASFWAVRKSAIRSFGWKVLHVALAGLAIDFALYSIIYTANIYIRFNTDFLSYNSVVDLVLQTALGFGMVIVLLEKVLLDARSAHERLEEANRRLEQLVHTDPLTAAFTRHAFYGFVKKHGDENTETSGCVGFFDIDDLKTINDRFGHNAGDHAIRLVAKAIRDLIRAEDLVYRWGGDEFFVIMISMDADMALSRMTKLESLLTGIRLYENSELIDIGVSWGFTDFSDISHLEAAINEADAAMYVRKLERKRRVRERAKFVPGITETPHGVSI